MCACHKTVLTFALVACLHGGLEGLPSCHRSAWRPEEATVARLGQSRSPEGMGAAQCQSRVSVAISTYVVLAAETLQWSRAAPS